jgi:hypothetical protein
MQDIPTCANIVGHSRQPVIEQPLKLVSRSAEMMTVDAPVPVLCFVLAVVVGYFVGRAIALKDRMRSDR